MASDANEAGTVRYPRCPSCGTSNAEDAVACARCGQPLDEAADAKPSQPAPSVTVQMVCSKCGKMLPAGSKVCGYCGAALPGPASAAFRAATGQSISQVAQAAVPSQAPASAVGFTVEGSPPASQPRTPSSAGEDRERTITFRGFQVRQFEASLTEVRPDGTPGKTISILQDISIGRENCTIVYPGDTLLSPRHASVIAREDRLILQDNNSQNGTFLKQRQDMELSPGDIFLLGRDLFRFTTQALNDAPSQEDAEATMTMMGAPNFQPGPITAKLEHIQLNGDVIEEFSLEKPETTIGRVRGDLIFKDDPYMSGSHARVVAQPGRFILQDLKSKNGVYRKIRGEAELHDGDEFFLGEQLFRVQIKKLHPSA